MPKKVVVECRLTVAVEVPDDWDDGRVLFHLEENGCPGTREVGAALGAAIEEHERKQTCWACALGGENRVVTIDGREVEKSPEPSGPLKYL